jgi:uncharacterized membrane protein YgaE (UPF0421/DUF939 family)
MASRQMKKLIIRVVLGVVFGFLLTWVFFPASGVETALSLAVLLVLFAYLLEFLRKRRGT